MPVEWEPGSKTLYHAATGVLIAAEIVRRKTGKSWNDFCRERLFDPLGAATLSYLVPGDDVPLALTPPPQELLIRPDAFRELHTIQFQTS